MLHMTILELRALGQLRTLSPYGPRESDSAYTTRFMATAHDGRGENARSRRRGQRRRKRSVEIV